MIAKLSATTPEVWARTLEAVKATADLVPNDVRCGKCRNVLANFATVPGYGPIFTSSWAVPVKPSAEIIVDGGRLSDRKSHQYQASQLVEGDHWDHDTHGVIALLALPSEMPQDYPDLMVRCQRDGDLILDRIAVIAWIRDNEQDVPVWPDGQRISYIDPQEGSGEATRRTARYRLTGDALPIEEYESRMRERRNRETPSD